MEDFVLFLFYMVALNGVLSVGCLVADYIFPNIPFIERYLESLPAWDDEEEVVSAESTTLFVADEFSELTEEQWQWLIARWEGKKDG